MGGNREQKGQKVCASIPNAPPWTAQWTPHVCWSAQNSFVESEGLGTCGNFPMGIPLGPWWQQWNLCTAYESPYDVQHESPYFCWLQHFNFQIRSLFSWVHATLFLSDLHSLYFPLLLSSPVCLLHYSLYNPLHQLKITICAPPLLSTSSAKCSIVTPVSLLHCETDTNHH